MHGLIVIPPSNDYSIAKSKVFCKILFESLSILKKIFSNSMATLGPTLVYDSQCIAGAVCSEFSGLSGDFTIRMNPERL